MGNIYKGGKQQETINVSFNSFGNIYKGGKQQEYNPLNSYRSTLDLTVMVIYTNGEGQSNLTLKAKEQKKQKDKRQPEHDFHHPFIFTYLSSIIIIFFFVTSRKPRNQTQNGTRQL